MGTNADGIPNYVVMAFRLYNEFGNPDWKLVFNQHGEDQQPMWDTVKYTALKIKEYGYRVDCIGAYQAGVNT
jgi:hypothetical protein